MCLLLIQPRCPLYSFCAWLLAARTASVSAVCTAFCLLLEMLSVPAYHIQFICVWISCSISVRLLVECIYRISFGCSYNTSAPPSCIACLRLRSLCFKDQPSVRTWLLSVWRPIALGYRHKFWALDLVKYAIQRTCTLLHTNHNNIIGQTSHTVSRFTHTCSRHLVGKLFCCPFSTIVLVCQTHFFKTCARVGYLFILSTLHW